MGLPLEDPAQLLAMNDWMKDGYSVDVLYFDFQKAFN